jgi:hypothetical protein
MLLLCIRLEICHGAIKNVSRPTHDRDLVAQTPQRGSLIWPAIPFLIESLPRQAAGLIVPLHASHVVPSGAVTFKPLCAVQLSAAKLRRTALRRADRAAGVTRRAQRLVVRDLHRIRSLRMVGAIS